MSKSFLERRHESPDYSLTARITGVRLGTTRKVEWTIETEGEDDPMTIAGILECVAEVIRNNNDPSL